MEDNFAQRMRLGSLFDIYGGLLTDKQRQCLGLYFYDDLSLSEIGDELGVSRQAVHDLLKRVEQTLERNEEKLRILERLEKERAGLRRAVALLQTGREADRQAAMELLQALSVSGEE